MGEAMFRLLEIATTINYTNSSAVTDGEIVWLDGVGALVAHDTYSASTEGVYVTRGKIRVALDSGENPQQGEKVYWDVSEDKAVAGNSSALASGDFFLGTALSDATASGGYVEVALNEDLTVADRGYRTITAETETVEQTDNIVILDGTSNTVTITLPDAATTAKYNKGFVFICKNADNAVTIQRAGSDTVMGSASITLDVRESVELRPVGTDWIAVSNSYNVASAAIGADSITGAKIADDAVSLEHLDSGITPSHIIALAGTLTTAGGATTEAVTLSGLVSTDSGVFCLRDSGTNDISIKSYTEGDGSVSIEFSGDPGSDAKVEYIVPRAAS